MRISKQTFCSRDFSFSHVKVASNKVVVEAHFLFNQQTTHKVKLGGPEKIYVFTFKCFITSRLAKLDNLNIQSYSKSDELIFDSIIMNYMHTGILIAILDNFC